VWVWAASLLTVPVAARGISFEDRVQAQAAIERIYYAHQKDATLPFDEAVPRDLLERKVTTYLRQSVALDERWHTPITAEALERELERIGRSTYYSDRLAEIYQALGNDPVRIEECFARPALVQRLARSFFESDPEIHREAAGRAAALYDDLVAGRIDARRESAGSSVTVYVVEPERPLDDMRSGTLAMSAEELADLRLRLPERLGVATPVENQASSFIIQVLLDEHVDRLEVASFRIPKRTWD